MKTIEFKAISYSGKDKINEDYILCHKLSDNSLIAILADGMGGLSYGAEAAKIVSESIMTTILDHVQDSSPENVLCMAFDAADTAISKKCKELKCRMGAAVTVALIIDDFLYYAWQGNVRLYKVCNGELILLSTDHIVANVEEPFLTRCVNGKGCRDKVPIKQEKLEQTDRIYICSDGCYQYVDFAELTEQNFIISAKNMFDDSSLIEINLI
ncbi:protein phosphatase 2C domain-containing protein [uncultured Bacteroides sp.]|uniref:PP2C family protein-serine/threonine phosphatase n=1 Tax=uncultured Bacteroides sp. TaxID=162156 RepID=UPI0025FA779C|nr:protein phosphatase 2C domain-containing protein [uncultured Bacteroides sp.]